MCCPSEGASVGMISVDCINFNSVGVQELKPHKIDENDYLDGGCASRLSANKAPLPSVRKPTVDLSRLGVYPEAA